MEARNYSLEITSLRNIILYKTDFETHTVLPCVTSWAGCFTNKHLWKTFPNKLEGKLKDNKTTVRQCQQRKTSKKILRCTFFLREIFLGAFFWGWRRSNFLGGNSSWGNFPGGSIFPGAIFQNTKQTYHKKINKWSNSTIEILEKDVKYVQS